MDIKKTYETVLLILCKELQRTTMISYRKRNKLLIAITTVLFKELTFVVLPTVYFVTCKNTFSNWVSKYFYM